MRLRRLVAPVVLVGLVASGCSGAPPAAEPSDQQIELGWTDAAQGRAIALPHDHLIVGEEVSPARGQAVLLNYWASTCAPCRKEMPLLQEFGERGVLVVGVTADRFAAYARRAVTKAGAAYANFQDADGAYAASELRGVVPLHVVPSSVVIRDGEVVKVHIGPFHSAAELDEALEP